MLEPLVDEISLYNFDSVFLDVCLLMVFCSCSLLCVISFYFLSATEENVLE